MRLHILWLVCLTGVASLFWVQRVLRRPVKPHSYLSPRWINEHAYERDGYDR